MFLRALKICDPEFLDEEIQTIYNLALELCYPIHFIDNCLQRARRTYFNSDRPNPFDMDNILVLPYRHEFLNIVNSLKCLNINVVFSNNSSVKNSLFRNKPTVDRGGVYQIFCSTCNIPYIGQTGKELSIRVGQHKCNIRTANNASALFCYVRDKNHPIDWNSAKIVFKSDSIQDRLLIEGCLINSFNNMNLTDGLFRMDELLKSIILKDKKVIKVFKHFRDH